jgi:hypothetical protein
LQFIQVSQLVGVRNRFCSSGSRNSVSRKSISDNSGFSNLQKRLVPGLMQEIVVQEIVIQEI